MLFHVTMTHTAEDCPGYNREKFPEIIAASEKMEEIAKQLNLKVHFYVEGAPEHVAYALLEADDVSSVLAFVSEIPYRQDFKVTVVQHLGDLIEGVKELMKK